MKKLLILLIFFFLLSCNKNIDDTKKDECDHIYSYNLSLDENYIEATCKTCDYSYKIAPNFNFSYNFGYSDLNNYLIRKNAQELYLNIYVKFLEFYRSNINLKETKKSGQNYYEIASINYANLALNKNQAMAIWHLVILDNPEFYFAKKTVLTSDTEIILLCDELYAKYEQRKIVNDKINELKNVIKKEEKIDILNEIYNYVINNLGYAYDTIGGEKVPKTSFDVYEISGALKDKEGVCEAYSKLFCYMLKCYGIKAIVYPGNGIKSSGEIVRHMWTLVEIDNQYYGFDLTWDDSNSNKDNYGLSFDNLSKKHKAIDDNSLGLDVGIDYVYKMPKMALENLV